MDLLIRHQKNMKCTCEIALKWLVYATFCTLKAIVKYLLILIQVALSFLKYQHIELYSDCKRGKFLNENGNISQDLWSF